MPTTHTSLRQPTLDTLGLGGVLSIFRQGKLPVTPNECVDAVFGTEEHRGAMVVSGANGIVGAGKTMQFASRLAPFDVPMVALDVSNSRDGLSRHYPGLVRAFGASEANNIMSRITRLTYDGATLPAQLKALRPRFLLEAVPEVLSIKHAHYEAFRTAFPDVQIRSVTSGFPSKQLGVGIAHPAFPHEINKVFEVVEGEPSDLTKLFWAIGLIPMTVSDDWSFVLDVLFCGLMNSAIQYHEARNMPYWKIDKYVRKYIGPNPFRAHDAIGAKGSNFLTWSCLHHLAEQYGSLFTPSPELVSHKNTGQGWYPPNHFRPLVDWTLDDEDDFLARILGPLFQMTTLMVHEQRSHLAQLNIIGELCAQFRPGLLASMRRLGPDGVMRIVERSQSLRPDTQQPWHPDTLDQITSPSWQQLYVNAEHDGSVGVITIGREAYNNDVDQELNRAMDWLRANGIERVIVSHDFHLATQLVGADINEFFAALEDREAGYDVSFRWSTTARRFESDFRMSVGFVGGKRCLGGMLELFAHCHFLVAEENASLGFPEVTLPVIPGMEGCHWPFRRTQPAQWPKLLDLLLGGQSIQAPTAVGWLVDAALPMNDAIALTWALVSGGDHCVTQRPLVREPLQGVPDTVRELPPVDQAMEESRRAISATVSAATRATLSEAIAVQSHHSADFMTSSRCKKGVVGQEAAKSLIS